MKTSMIKRNAEIDKALASSHWIAVAICISLEGQANPNAMLSQGSGKEQVTAAYLIPCDEFSKALAALRLLVADMPGVVSRGGGPMSLMFETANGLLEIDRKRRSDLSAASGVEAGLAVSLQSQFSTRGVWLLDSGDPRAKALGAGLCISYEADMAISDAAGHMSRALAIEAVGCLAGSMAEAMFKRASLCEVPKIALDVGPCGIHDWRVEVHPVAQSLFLSLSERSELSSKAEMSASIPSRRIASI